MDTPCTRYRTELSALADGQLDGKTQSEVQAHLIACEPCSQELSTIKSLTQFLSSGLKSDTVETPNLWAKIQSSLPSVCEVMREDLSAYLDGELSPAAQEGVNKHLKECSECLQEFKLLNQTNRLLNKGLQLPASIKVDLWPAVKAQLNEDCALIRNELSAYADMEVVPLRHRGITSHLMNCLDCRDQFNKLSSVGDIIRDSYKPEIQEDFDLWLAIRSKMTVVPFAQKAGSQPQKQKSVRPRLIATAAAAAIVGLMGVLLTFATPRPAESETISSESYLIQSALQEPSDVAEAVVYEQQ